MVQIDGSHLDVIVSTTRLEEFASGSTNPACSAIFMHPSSMRFSTPSKVKKEIGSVRAGPAEPDFDRIRIDGLSAWPKHL